jgi:Na+/melibiose symporter-like transporter
MFDRLILPVVVSLLAAVALLAVLGAAGLLCAALYLWLATMLTPAQAAAATAGALLLFALVLTLGTWIYVRSRRRQPRAAADPRQMAGWLGMMAAEGVLSSVRARPFTALLVATTAGFVVGLRPDLVRHLFAALERASQDDGTTQGPPRPGG